MEVQVGTPLVTRLSNTKLCSKNIIYFDNDHWYAKKTHLFISFRIIFDWYLIVSTNKKKHQSYSNHPILEHQFKNIKFWYSNWYPNRIVDIDIQSSEQIGIDIGVQSSNHSILEYQFKNINNSYIDMLSNQLSNKIHPTNSFHPHHLKSRDLHPFFHPSLGRNGGSASQMALPRFSLSSAGWGDFTEVSQKSLVLESIWN